MLEVGYDNSFEGRKFPTKLHQLWVKLVIGTNIYIYFIYLYLFVYIYTNPIGVVYMYICITIYCIYVSIAMSDILI